MHTYLVINPVFSIGAGFFGHLRWRVVANVIIENRPKSSRGAADLILSSILVKSIILVKTIILVKKVRWLVSRFKFIRL